MKAILRSSRQLIVYGMIGCMGASLDFIIFWLLTNRVGIHYQLSNFIGVLFGITNNFFLNAYFNFKTTDRLFVRFISFLGVGLTGWGMSAGLLWVFIDRMGMANAYAKLLTIFFVTAVQFVLNKFITFKKRS